MNFSLPQPRMQAAIIKFIYLILKFFLKPVHRKSLFSMVPPPCVIFVLYNKWLLFNYLLLFQWNLLIFISICASYFANGNAPFTIHYYVLFSFYFFPFCTFILHPFKRKCNSCICLILPKLSICINLNCNISLNHCFS